MLFDKLVEFYKSISWEMSQVPNQTILYTRYQGKWETPWDFVASSNEPNNTIVMFARSPFPCHPEKLGDLSIFMQLANFGLSLGAWVVDRSDGEIRFRVGYEVGSNELTQAYLRKMTLYTNLTMETYLPGLQALFQDGRSGEEAYKVVFPNT